MRVGLTSYDQVQVGVLPYSAALTIAITVAFFDFCIPLGVAAGVPYVALVLVGIWFPKHHHVLILATIGSLLVIVGYLVSPSGGTFWVVIANRGLALFVIWITAILITLRKGAEISLLNAHDELEQLVDERTNKLQKSEEQLRQFIEQAPDAVYVQDTEGNILLANKQACVQTGYTKEELLNLNITDISTVTKSERVKNIKRLSEVGLLTQDSVHQRKDGSVIPPLLGASASRIV